MFLSSPNLPASSPLSSYRAIKMDPSPPLISKKLSNIIRAAFFTVQKGVSKGKLMFDFNSVMKRGNKIFKEAAKDLMLHHQDALSCRPSDVHMSFVSPRAISCRPDDTSLAFVSPLEYEFSCSSSPVHQVFHNPFHSSKNRSSSYYTPKHNISSYKRIRYYQKQRNSGRASGRRTATETSPMVGWTSLVRKVKMTESPFPARDTYDVVEDQDYHVDREADKFIDKFYRDLRLQQWMDALEPIDYQADRMLDQYRS